MASVSALFLALVGLLGQLATRELSVFPALFLRYLASTVVVLIVLRGDALQTLKGIGRLEWLRVASVLISQFCLFYYLAHGSLLIGMLLYNTGPLFSPILARLLLGITSTARQAFEHGYNVTIAVDAVTDLNADAHARSLDWIFPMLGELSTTDEILSLLSAMRT
jgi:Isochorismatase family/EamA-like transporter family